MDLSHPLGSLIPSLDAVALEVLVGTQIALGSSKIHQLAHRGSRQGIANALERLVEHGLVLSEPTNFGSVYRLNRDHLLTTSVLQAANARHELLERLTDACSNLHPTPASVTLFGSVARKDSTVSSDIDLLVVHEQELEDLELWNDQIYELSLKVRSWTGNRLHVLTESIAHLTDLTHVNEPIAEEWRREGLTLYGVKIRDLLNREPGVGKQQ